MLTQRQIQSSIEVGPLIDTAADCLRFVTEFFDVIRQSGPHIYHSALLLAPQSSAVRNMYSQHICPPVSDIINGIPASWDPCTASAGAINIHGVLHAVWSPCGRFVATSFGDEVQVRDSNTLERLSAFKPPPRNHPASPRLSIPILRSRNHPASFGFLAFSPDGRLLACAASRLVASLVSVPVLIPVSRFMDKDLFVWDVQTGVAVADDRLRGSGQHNRHHKFNGLVFSGNCRTATLLTGYGAFYVYDVPNGTCMCEGKLAVSSSFLLGAHWAHGDTLRVATSFKTNEKLVINIQELQPLIDPPLLLVESFPLPPRDGGISFSPVSFHASFVSEIEVVILDVRDSRILLRVETSHSPYIPLGHFSPNGCFFACGTEKDEIRVWKNPSAGYVPWSDLRPRLSFTGFSFSPTTSSILAWGLNGVQLLEYGNHPTVLSPNKLERRQQRGTHLVAYSADPGTRIAMARRKSSVVTILDALPNIPRQSFNTDMRILDIKIVGNVIFVADGHKLVSWDLETREPVHNDETSAITTSIPHPHLTLSDNCSEIAFANGNMHQKISLYDVQARRIVCSLTTQFQIEAIRFSPDGRQLWLAASSLFGRKISLVKLERREDGDFADVTGRIVTNRWVNSEPPWTNLFFLPSSSHYWRPERVLKQADSGRAFEWVVDSRGNKLLWLPLSWRARGLLDVRCDSDFLAFVGCDHPEPIIIRFRS